MTDHWSVIWTGEPGAFERYQGEIIEDMVQEASRTYLGYQLCRDCDAPVLDEVAKRTGRRCPACFGLHYAATTRDLEILVDGARSVVSVDRKKRKYGSRGSRDTRRKAETAKRRALRRLRWANPTLYGALLASEREKLGLEPSPLSQALSAPSGTISDPETYAQPRVEDGDPPSDAPDPERGPLR